MIERYVSKISGPLLDRIDIHIEVPAVKYKELRTPSSCEDSAAVRQRVIDARDQHTEPYRADKKTYSSAQMMPKMIRKYCAITPEGEKLLENATTRLGLSAEAHDRILKVARTIADLDAAENIEPRHLSAAIQYRTLEGVAVAVRGTAISVREQRGNPRAAPPLTLFPSVCYP
jgi:magnesium chelatase family protein